MTGGVALLDYHSDGFLDIFVVNGARIHPGQRDNEAPDKSSPDCWNRLYHNKHDGSFTDVTEKAGVRGNGFGMGVAIGDFDNDGLAPGLDPSLSFRAPLQDHCSREFQEEKVSTESTVYKMSSEAREIRQNAHKWVDGLTDEQAAAVAPLLDALTALLAASSREAPLLSRIAESEKEFLSETPTHQSNGRSAPLGSPGSATSDATTGLPARLIFERAVCDALTQGRESVVALFIVERLAYINKRFGRVAGEEILLHVAQYLAQELPDSSTLARWSGPAFAAILDSTSAAKRTEMQIRAIASKRLSKTIDSGGRRAVMIPISCSCTVESLNAENSPEAIFTRMDDFLAAHSSESY
jgi:GGDEF domain-containing protein